MIENSDPMKQKRPPINVLCVCLGNICRSPTAEVVLCDTATRHGLAVTVDSAGTSNYHPNKAPDPRSQRHARARGYELSGLRARQLRDQDFVEFDWILAMDHDNLHDIMQQQRQAAQRLGMPLRAKIALMSEHDVVWHKQAVPDPYYGDAQDFERVIDQCESAAQGWLGYWQQEQH